MLTVNSDALMDAIRKINPDWTVPSDPQVPALTWEEIHWFAETVTKRILYQRYYFGKNSAEIVYDYFLDDERKRDYARKTGRPLDAYKIHEIGSILNKANIIGKEVTAGSYEHESSRYWLGHRHPQYSKSGVQEESV